MYLHPLQALNVAHCNSMRPPRVWRVDNSSHFLACGPIAWVLSSESTIFKLLDRALRPLCADFSPGIQHLGRLGVLLAAPSDYRRRQRESFNAIEDR